ncbi:exo-beta-N-acetylmuramidase NamZ family protein [Gilvibacter sp.]|uniref:exo-beta-N-acetylmuramidase NamZ family protein n=1 Tax=Gilvibacter sp. TaxID=2729997 RepID=UPI003F4A0F35
MTVLSLKNTLLFLLIVMCSCGSKSQESEDCCPEENPKPQITPIPAANKTEAYLPLLEGKRVAVVANQTSGINDGKIYLIRATDTVTGDTIFNKRTERTHLVDSLLARGVNIVKVFAPEHGFRGRADAGESVKDGVDTKTGLALLSLHGKHRKPMPEQLTDVDIIVFDIQDVGVRFYTYISTMSLVMEAAAEAGIPIIVLDRPNPNGHYIDGPTMLAEHTSFLGMHTVPLVYGMTIGEYALMVNGEGWLKDGVKADLTVIQNTYYNHRSKYVLPVRPSPNLPNATAVNLYPSLGLLEGTNLNAGRGTDYQFQLLGSPYLPQEKYTYQYTPQPNFGSKYPKHQDTDCNGLFLGQEPYLSMVDLQWIVQAYRNHTKKDEFFNTANFTTHAGTPLLQQQIQQGLSAEEIRASWQPEIEAFKKIRAKYLLYEE